MKEWITRIVVLVYVYTFRIVGRVRRMCVRAERWIDGRGNDGLSEWPGDKGARELVTSPASARVSLALSQAERVSLLLPTATACLSTRSDAGRVWGFRRIARREGSTTVQGCS